MLDVATETFALPIWAVAVIAALFAVACALAFVQTGANDVLRTIARTGVVFVGVVLVVWIFLDRTAMRDREAERRALDARASELAVRAVAPGSPLACLDAIAGDAVETACERALFSSPEVVASAVSYVSARLNLLAHGLEFTSRSDPAYGPALLALRQSLEIDRFGVVAQVLSLRDSCTPTQCDTFALLRDTSRVRANLRDRAFDGYVARYSASWSTTEGRAGTPVTDASSSPATYTGAIAGPAMSAPISSVPSPASAATSAAVPTRPSSRYDFPSASTIPPVSIMNPEPEPSAGRAPAASAPGTPALQRKPAAAPRATAAAAATPRSAAPQSVTAPVQLAPVSPPAGMEPGPSLQ
jgi:hypothetical protein